MRDRDQQQQGLHQLDIGLGVKRIRAERIGVAVAKHSLYGLRQALPCNKTLLVEDRVNQPRALDKCPGQQDGVIARRYVSHFFTGNSP